MAHSERIQDEQQQRESQWLHITIFLQQTPLEAQPQCD